jgi:hypothetical protein
MGTHPILRSAYIFSANRPPRLVPDRYPLTTTPVGMLDPPRNLFPAFPARLASIPRRPYH